MATAEQWLGKLAHLKVDKARGDPAPHKPLLLLVVLELAEQGPHASRWRMSSPKDFLGADCENERVIQAQCGNRGAPLSRQSDHAHAVPAKMILPALLTWMKENDLASALRIPGRPTRLFAERTGNAGQGKVVRRRLAAGIGGDDVIDVESSFLACLGEAAIFAAATRTSRDQAP